MSIDVNGANGNGAGRAQSFISFCKGRVVSAKVSLQAGLPSILSNRGKNVHCIDGDPVNRSLAQYKSLNAEKLDLVNEEGLIVRIRYDALLERFAKEDGLFL